MLGTELECASLQFFQNRYRKCRKENFGHFLIDRTPSCPSFLLFCTFISPRNGRHRQQEKSPFYPQSCKNSRSQETWRFFLTAPTRQTQLAIRITKFIPLDPCPDKLLAALNLELQRMLSSPLPLPLLLILLLMIIDNPTAREVCPHPCKLSPTTTSTARN